MFRGDIIASYFLRPQHPVQDLTEICSGDLSCGHLGSSCRFPKVAVFRVIKCLGASGLTRTVVRLELPRSLADQTDCLLRSFAFVCRARCEAFYVKFLFS